MIKLHLAAVAIMLLAATSSANAANASATSLFARGDFPAAATAYESLLRMRPSDVTAELDLGAIRLYENDLRAAEPLLRAVLAKDPYNARAARLIVELERRQAESTRGASVTGGESAVPFVTADPLPVVRGLANGVAGTFIIDTGADVDLEPSFAASIGVKTEGAGTGVFAGGERAAIKGGTLQSLALGGASARYVPVHVFPTHAAALFGNLHVDGVIGTTYFERFLVTIDYPQRRLVLRARSPESSAAFQAAAAGATIVPCYLAGDHFVLARAQVNNAPAGLFLFDSGLAGGGIMSSAQLVKAAAIRLERDKSGTGYGGGGAVTAVPFVAQRIAVGSAVQHDVRGIFTPQGSPLGIFPFTVWGAISNDFLAHYAYTVDFDAMKIVLAPSPPAPSPPAPSPHPTSSPAQPPTVHQIFDAAFRRLQSYPAPPYAVWTATWNIRQRPMGYYTGERTGLEVMRYAVRLSDGMENASEPIPSGKLPPAEIVTEFVGPFAWNMRSSVRVAPAAGGRTMQPDVAGLKTIATVTAIANAPYAIAGADSGNVPIENVDGHRAYHLELRPRSDPQRHNLRDLWIDTTTYDLWKLHFVGRYAPTPDAPSSPTEATVYFRNVLGCWVVTRAVWTWDDPPVEFTFDVENDEIALPETLPDWLFSAAEYRKHQDAGEPDYLGRLLERMRAGASSAPTVTKSPNG